MKQTAQKNGPVPAGNSIAHAVSKNAAQLKKQAPATGIGFTQQPVQRIMNTQDNTLQLDNHLADIPPARAFTGGATKSVIFHEMTKTTSPYDPVGMDNWKKTNYIKDPSKNNRQNLTRMHAIRGRFGGPSAANNMFLGTALSNNFHADSHFKQVEQPLENFITRGPKGSRAVRYQVQPLIGSVPPYISDRIGEANNAGQPGFNGFAHAAIPHQYECTADLYLKHGGSVYTKQVFERLNADVGSGVAGPALHPEYHAREMKRRDDEERELEEQMKIQQALREEEAHRAQKGREREDRIHEGRATGGKWGEGLSMAAAVGGAALFLSGPLGWGWALAAGAAGAYLAKDKGKAVGANVGGYIAENTFDAEAD